MGTAAIVLTWLGVLAQVLPLLGPAEKAIEGLVEAIRGTPGLTPQQIEALVVIARSGLAEENARVQVVPVP
jgi:hypothetical protein